MGNGFMWAAQGLFAVVAIIPAITNGWQPWEVISLVAVLSVAGVLLAAAAAWQAVRVRQLELAALSSDEQASRLLGEALGRCGRFLETEASREVWNAFHAAPSQAKRAMTLAVIGFLSEEVIESNDLNEKLVVLAHSFFRPTELLVPKR